jgi:chitinase
VGHHAPLYPWSGENEWQAKFNVNWTINFWLTNGAPKNKLLLGLPTYGRTFKLVNPSLNQIGSPALSGGGNPGNVSILSKT